MSKILVDKDVLEQALEALQAYGSHAPNCDHLVLLTSLPPQRKPCSCGLSANITAIRDALAEPVQEPFFTEANGFPQTFVPKDRQKQAIISLTDQCAALIQERDELQKQVWLYEKNGVTCQTYRHTVEQSCAECNVQMNYTAPPQRKPLTEEEIEVLAKKHNGIFYGCDIEFARAIERAHGIKE